MDNKKDGVVYTPESIVKKMLSKIEIGNDILEPACGKGAFLKNLKGNVDAFDIDSEAINEAKNINGDVNYFNEDFLKFNFEKQYDTIIGNPPYIRFQDLDKEYRKYLQNNFVSCQNGNFDIFYAFIEKCVSLLKPLGEMILIVPNSWLTNKSAFNLRNLLKNFDIEITDFDTEKNFKEADTYTVFLYLKNKNGEVRIIKEEKEYIINDKEKEWVIGGTKNSIDLSIIKNGIATLCDKLFIFDKFVKNEDTTKIYCSYNNNWYDIENTVLRNCAKISKHQNNICIYPYDNNGTPFEEEYISNNYPLLYKYLVDVKDRLLKRDYDGKWYCYGRSQGISTMYGKKILISTLIKDKIKYYISDDKNLIAYSGLYINIENKTETEIKEIIDYLSDDELNKFIINNGKSMSGGYHSFSKTILKAAQSDKE